jgi:hypothetical protein
MVTKQEWDEAIDKEREDDIHPCNHFDIALCDCKGACSCHWIQIQDFSIGKDK